MYDTLWLGKGEKFYEVKWFRIDTRKDVYVETIEEFKEIAEIQNARLHLRYSRNNEITILDEKYYKIAVSILNKRSGYKSLKVRHITKMERRQYEHKSRYFVCYEKNGKNYSVSL